MSEEKNYEEKVHVTLDDLEDIKEIVALNRKLHSASMTQGQGMAMAILEDSVDLALEKFGAKP